MKKEVAVVTIIDVVLNRVRMLDFFSTALPYYLQVRCKALPSVLFGLLPVNLTLCVVKDRAIEP